MYETTEPQQKRSKLWKMSYLGSEMRLTTYADTIVYDQVEGRNLLIAIRFGGYPEQVRGMADAIYGGGTIHVEMEDKVLVVHSVTKQYRRLLSHEGIYAEATLLIEDDSLKTEDALNKSDSRKETSNDLKRTSYLFCDKDNDERLFEEIDKKVSVPLISDFKDCLLTKLQAADVLKRLTVLSSIENFDAWKIVLSKNDRNIIEIVEDALKSKEIEIPGSSNTNDGVFAEITTVSKYLNTFGVTIAEKIKGQFNPLFDPSKENLSDEILQVNNYIHKKVGYSLYDAQLAEAEAIKRQIARSKVALCVAECGSGKTKIGITSLFAYQRMKGFTKTFNVVLCPSHLTKKWVREIEESLPNTFAVHVKSITELEKVYDAFAKDSKNCYVVISKEKARDGYMTRPSVIWNQRKKSFLCPTCYKPIEMDVLNDGSEYKVSADQFFFQKQNSKNRKCSHCQNVLWAPLVPTDQSEWVKISNYGFIHRAQADVHLAILHSKTVSSQTRKNKSNNKGLDASMYEIEFSTDNPNYFKIVDEEMTFPKTYYDIKDVVENPEKHFVAVGAYVRFPLSTYINRKMKGRIDGLIIDELQDYNNNSGQGDAMNELFGVAKKVIGLTGTLINGYSSGIFYLLYRIAPHLMQIDDKKYGSTKEFNDEYGVTENVYELASPEYNANRRTLKKKLREKQLPGVSPLVYSRFLMESTGFLSLNDMGKQLPEYEEIPVELQLREDVREEYLEIERTFIDVLKFQKDIATKVMSAFVSLLTVFSDQPYDMKPIVNPKTGSLIIAPKNISCFEDLNEKDQWLLEKVKEKIAMGERVIVYTSWVKIDTQDKLHQLFRDHNIKAEILSSTVAPNKREEWVEKRVNDGIQVLITNPQLVETGLDLNDFTTLVYYNISYKLFTLRQSSRRSWRINQRAPRIEVYFLYFSNVMQHRAIRLMASKLAVAGIIEGSFSDEGLAAMSECQDLTTLLAQELTMGIKNEVEDLGAVFKKMAILKPEVQTDQEKIQEMKEEISTEIKTEEVSPVKPNCLDNSQTQIETEVKFVKQQSLIQSIEETLYKPKSTRKKSKDLVWEDQITIFDYLESISA